MWWSSENLGSVLTFGMLVLSRVTSGEAQSQSNWADLMSRLAPSEYPPRARAPEFEGCGYRAGLSIAVAAGSRKWESSIDELIQRLLAKLAPPLPAPHS